jgi:hypothetical protein
MIWTREHEFVLANEGGNGRRIHLLHLVVAKAKLIGVAFSSSSFLLASMHYHYIAWLEKGFVAFLVHWAKVFGFGLRSLVLSNRAGKGNGNFFGHTFFSSLLLLPVCHYFR